MSESVSTEIVCPSCGHCIDVNEVLSHKLDKELRAKYEAKAAEDKEALTQQLESLALEKQRLLEAKELQQEEIKLAVEKKLNLQSEELQKKIYAQVTEEQHEQNRALQNELNEKSEKLKDYNKVIVDMERLKREKSELKDAIEAESAKKLTAQLILEKERIQKAAAEQSRLSVQEKENVIEQLKNQLDIAKRKAEQGSTQLQGEVQEVAIELWLQEQFPLDIIEEIKKGSRGADCLQIVNTLSQQNCGSIYYESKRTQNFQPLWIEKFKEDIREKGADIGVLVTQSMPADMPALGLKEGVWVCSFDEFKGLSLVLRESMIRMSKAVATQENRGEKMVMLYDYLTGNEFRMQVEAIVEGFSKMQEDLSKEKRAMAAIWKKREKQLDKVLLNTTHLYSSIQGIAGSAIKSLPALELPGAESEEASE